MAETALHPSQQALTNDGDHDRFAHYVRKGAVLEGHVMGRPTKALCGKVFTPTRDPDRYPICPTCKEIRARVFGT